ncbi:MAG: DNA polymerase III subunit gamma/tau [Burkholderiales bacterium]|nr:DNA polymerase III subunit gamma/tau [Burkholderiales bacterium]
MSYLVLARKYRPRDFAGIVGQEHVVRALSHALATQRLHHAWLFTGTRGVGKTTISRILAKALNCETGVSATPCGVCPTCVAIDAGRFTDYVEMDAASNRGVDEITQVLESAAYKQDASRYKVLMIDEVHMLTNTAFNAMLKTLEEPPEHVKFVLATTDPQKIPVTVLSRCLQFNLKQMPQPHIVAHLETVLAAEKVAADRAALRLIARAAAGSMRDALSLTDQAIAYGGGAVAEAAVRGMLGSIDDAYLVRVLDALVEEKADALFEVAAKMRELSASFAAALADLATLLSRIAVAQAHPDAVAEDAPDRDDVLRLAKALGPEEVQLYYQIVILGRNDLAYAPDEETGFTMTLLRMLNFRPQEAGAAVVAPRAAATPAKAGAARGTGAMPGAASAVASTGAAPVRMSAHAGAGVASEPAPATPPGRGNAAPAIAASAASAPFDGDWTALIARLPLTGFVRNWANQTELSAHEPGLFSLRVPGRTQAEDRSMQEKLRASLEQYFGRPVRLAVSVGDMQGASVAAVNERAADARQREAEASIKNDPFVRELVEKTGARVTDIRPSQG